jgi:cytochrome c556
MTAKDNRRQRACQLAHSGIPVALQEADSVLRKLVARAPLTGARSTTSLGESRMQSLLKFRPSLAAAALALVTALPASAQFQKPEQAIKYRQSVMTLQGAHMGRIGAMTSGRVPFDAAAVQANADIVSTVSKLPFTAFGDGTDKGAPTRAKPEIWSNRADFEAKAKTFQDEVVKLQAAAKTGNQDQVKTAFGAVGDACKGCHDKYQKEQ